MSFLATTYSSSNNGKMHPLGTSIQKSSKSRQIPNKRVSPKAQNSFQFNLSSILFKKSRSGSREKSHNLSMGNITTHNRRSTSMNITGLDSSVKLINGTLGLKDLESSKKISLKQEFIASWMEKAQSEIKSGDYESGLKGINKVLKIEPNYCKALFIRSNCYISTNRHKLAIPDLLSIIQENSRFDKYVYIALAICFVELNDFNTAIRQLTKGISIFPNFTDGFINRGMLFNQQQRWDKAVNDFHQAISLNPNKGTGYLGLADSLIGMGNQPSALLTIEKALKDPGSIPQALLKRGKIYFDQQCFGKALKDLNKVLDLQTENVEAFYYKAFALLGLNNITDAGLCLEQVIKYDASKKYTGAAIYNLGAIKIKQRDYYGAMFTFKRSVDLGLEIEEQKVLKSYVEAILLLMKRKFKESVNMLSKIIKSKNQLIQEYIGNCYAFRGYGYASLELHEKAVKDLNTASGLQALDKSSDYNLKISKAILMSDKDPQAAYKLFLEAGKEFPRNIEHIVYCAAIHFRLSQTEKKQDLAASSIDLLNSCIKIRDTESELYFFRGIVNYYMGKTVEAVHDIELAIDKAEDNVVDHFVARGLCSGRLKMYKEAIQDFCIAIQLNEKCSEAYYYRGRCGFILGDTDMAFEDFNKLSTLDPNSPSVHLQAGNLLMLTGAVEDALKAFDNANSLSVTSECFIQKAKCYLLIENLPDAINELKSCSKISSSPSLNYDLEVLEILRNSHNKENLQNNLIATLSCLSKVLDYKYEGFICNSGHVHWYKGIFLFFLGNFQKSKTEFNKATISNDDSDDESIEKENIELLYNISIIYILGENYVSALTHLNEIVYYLEGKDRGKILLLMAMLNASLDQSKESKSLASEALKFDPETVQSYLDKKPEIKILPLSSNSKFASIFPMAKVKIIKSHTILLRPSFSLPKVELPRMEFDTEKYLLEKFTVKAVKCKPETPWLNRIKGSIQFTDEIQEIETESLDDSVAEAIKIEDTVEYYSETTLRKYKSESISIKENELESYIEKKSSDSSLEEGINDFDDIDFY